MARRRRRAHRRHPLDHPTCIAHDVNPRAYLHLVTKLIVHGWPQKKLRELLPDRILAARPVLFVGERDAQELSALSA